MLIQYKCRCMGEFRSVNVPDRVANTDIADWMPVVQTCVGYDHTFRFPICRRQEADLKIPMPEGTDQIGTPVIRN